MILEQNPTARTTLMDDLQALSGWADWMDKYPEKDLRLKKILSTAQLVNFPGAILPRLLQGRMVYYAVADTGKHWRMLQGVLRSFVGTTLSDFEGLTAKLDPTDPFEAYLTNHLGGTIARFSPGGIRPLEQSTVEALVRLVELAEGDGRVQRVLPRSTRQVLADYRFALAGGNDSAAGQALIFLREHMRLDALNLYFLEVERYQARQDWKGLAKATFFPALAQARRPPRVTGALLEALYQTEVAPVVVNGELGPVRNAFEERIRNPYGSLLKVLPAHPRPGVALLFLLEAYLEKNPQAPIVGLVKGALPGFPLPERTIAGALLDSLTELAEPADPRVEPAQRLALLTNETASATPQGALPVVVNALEADSLVAFQEAFAYIEQLSEADRTDLLQQRSFRTLWKELLEAAGNHRVPSSWMDVVQMLPTLHYAQVKALAERALVEWSVADQLKTPADAEALAAAIQHAWSAATREEITALLPYLVQWVARDEAWPNPVCLSLYEALLMCLNLSDQHGQGLLDATSTLLHGCLKLGLSRSAYQSLLTDLGDRAATVAGLTTADWVIDLGEQTLIHPCPDPGARQALWTRVQTALLPVLSRLKDEQLAMIDVISGPLGVAPIRPAAMDARPSGGDRIPAGVLALYTLQEGVAQRVESILTRIAPGIRVEVCNDLVATDRVKHLARTADHFIVCWQDAKHAVTQEVSRLRPRNQPVRWAPGAGSSGVLRIVRECWPSA